jgi:hypothetical protein
MRALISDIVKHAARLSGFTAADIRGKSRIRQVVRVRQAVCLIAREQLRQDGECVVIAYSFPQIAAVLGSRDHSTIIHACRTARNLAARDQEYGDFIAQLRSESADGVIFLQPAPEPVAEPAPVVPIWTMPVGLRPRLKSVPTPRQWEEIDLPSEHRMRLDQDGWTLDDHNTRDGMVAGSRKLADAIQQARAA